MADTVRLLVLLVLDETGVTRMPGYDPTALDLGAGAAVLRREIAAAQCRGETVEEVAAELNTTNGES